MESSDQQDKFSLPLQQIHVLLCIFLEEEKKTFLKHTSEFIYFHLSIWFVYDLLFLTI